MLSLAAFAATSTPEGWLDVSRGPVFVSPKPEDAHTDAEFFEKVAVPFWRKHIVDSFHAPEGMDEKTAPSIVKVREALVRKLATACAAITASAATPTLVTTSCGLAAITHSLSGYSALGAGICAGRGAEW